MTMVTARWPCNASAREVRAWVRKVRSEVRGGGMVWFCDLRRNWRGEERGV